MDESVYIYIGLRRGMNPTILPIAIDRIAGKTGLFNLGIAAGLREGKL